MAKKQKEYKYSAEYRTARRNLLRNVRSLEKRGYDVSAIKIPELVTGRAPKLSEVRALQRANDTRYDKAKRYEEVRVKTDTGFEYKVKKVSGKIARQRERTKAGKKVSESLKKYNKLTPEEKDVYRRFKQGEKEGVFDKGFAQSYRDMQPVYRERESWDSDNEYDDVNDEDDTSYDEDYEEESDSSSYQKFNKKDYNKINKPSTPVPAKSIAEEQKQRDTKLANVLADLAELANLTGLPKGKKWASMASTIQNNAQQIMDQMIEWAKTDPDAFFSALNGIEKGKGFSTVEVVYQRAGVDRYLQKYKDAMNYYHKTQDYNEDTDAYIEQDYDED